jgi:hypothetical protein
MLKSLPLVMLLLLPSLNTLAQSPVDVNTQVANCLTATSSAPGSKIACVQQAITNEGKNQIATFFQIYANTVNSLLPVYGGDAGTKTPTSPSGSSSGGNVGISSTPMASTVSNAGVSTTVQSSGGTTVPAKQPTKGGIQYY